MFGRNGVYQSVNFLCETSSIRLSFMLCCMVLLFVFKINHFYCIKIICVSVAALNDDKMYVVYMLFSRVNF